MTAVRTGERTTTRQSGLSLVELMVAITIGAILLGGAVSLFVNNKVTYQVTSDLSRLQENARFALDMMVRDIRMAGYFGCVNDMNRVVNDIPTIPGPDDGTLWDVRAPVEGVDNATGGSSWTPSSFAVSTTALGENGGIAPGTDAITIRYALGASVAVTSGTPTQVTVADASPFTAGDVAVVSDCGAADVFIVNTITGTTQLTPTAALSRAYEADSNPIASTLYAARYYVGTTNVFEADNVTRHTSLFRETYTFTPGTGPGVTRRELIDGIEQMQLLYGIDNNDDGAPDSYVDAGAAGLTTANDWRTVVTVRIALLLRTIDQYGRVVDDKAYFLNGPGGPQFGPYNDTRQRRLFITTAVVRNLQ